MVMNSMTKFSRKIIESSSCFVECCSQSDNLITMVRCSKAIGLTPRHRMESATTSQPGNLDLKALRSKSMLSWKQLLGMTKELQ